MSDPSADLLAEIDATLKLGRERHLDFRVRAFDLLVRLRPMVEQDAERQRLLERTEIRMREFARKVREAQEE